MVVGPTLSAAVIVGAAVAAFSEVRPAAALAPAVAAGALAVATGRSRLRVACIVVGVAALAAAHAAAARDRVLHPQPAALFEPPETADATTRSLTAGVVTVTGRLLEDAQPVRAGGVRLLLDVSYVERGGSTAAEPASARFVAQLYVGGNVPPEAAATWTRGRIVRASVQLSVPAVLRNPGGRSERWQLLLRPYHVTGSVKSALLVDASRGSWPEEGGAVVRRHVRAAISSLIGPSRAEAAGVIVAILIGDRTGLPQDTTRRLQAAGTYHVIAISGGNIALLAGLALTMARVVARSYRAAALETMIVVLVYGWIVGGEPSVGRAVSAACVYLAAVAVGLAPAASHVLAAAAMLVVLLDPLTVVQPGAWLSYGATLGILLFASRILRAVQPAAGPHAAWWRRAAGMMLALLAATVAAEIVLMPISAAVFTRVGLAGLLLNFIAIPASAVVQCAGLAAVCLFGWWDAAASAAASVAAGGVWALVASTALLDLAPWLSWRTPPPSPVWLAGFYLAVGVLVAGKGGVAVRRAAAGCAGAMLIGVLTAPELLLARPRAGWLRLTMIDVGQGDALLVQFPTGHVLLVDAGAATDAFDVGDRVVTPALWALGVRSLDWLAITHADLDHVGGAASIADTFGPRELWEGVPVPSNPHRERLRTLVAGRGGAWRQLRRGDRLTIGAIDLDVLHPPEPDWERQRVRNDDSLVIRLQYGDVEMLLTGDVGAAIERDLLARSPRPRLRVLKVAHHGSRSSTGAAFVRAFDPVAALVSAGPGNVFGHPAPDVLARLAGAHTRTWRTDRDGAVSVETDGHDVWVRPWVTPAPGGEQGSAGAWVARVWSPPP